MRVIHKTCLPRVRCACHRWAQYGTKNHGYSGHAPSKTEACFDLMNVKRRHPYTHQLPMTQNSFDLFLPPYKS